MPSIAYAAQGDSGEGDAALLFQDGKDPKAALWQHSSDCSLCQPLRPGMCLTACLTCRDSQHACPRINQLWSTQQSSHHSVIATLYVAPCRYGSGMTARESSSGSLQATPLQILRSQQQSPWGHLHSQELIDLNTAQLELMDGDGSEGEVELLDRRANSMPSLQVRHEGRSLHSLVV